MKNIYKTLEAIEVLVSDDFALDMECFAHNIGNQKFSKLDLYKMLKEAAKRITEIYVVAHAENTKGCNHEDWEQKKYEIISKNNSEPYAN
jgi:hypothetical protein